MDEHKLTLTRVKKTPGTVRYDSDDNNSAITNLYISKDAAESLDSPKQIDVIIRAHDPKGEIAQEAAQEEQVAGAENELEELG